jgi:hypothetical protein
VYTKRDLGVGPKKQKNATKVTLQDKLRLQLSDNKIGGIIA